MYPRCLQISLRMGTTQVGMLSSDVIDCGRSRLKLKYTEEQKELIINTYLEQGSLRGMQRFDVAPETLMGWIKK